ncbi:MAG TPA: hypothetical protein VKA60_12815 [Blastocatellia bacterium]|nr:hypothetical protein [Blastocatellia bacterium]
MTIKLVKKNQQTKNDVKPAQEPTFAQLLANAQGWVEEYKSHKASHNEALIGMLRRS